MSLLFSIEELFGSHFTPSSKHVPAKILSIRSVWGSDEAGANTLRALFDRAREVTPTSFTLFFSIEVYSLTELYTQLSWTWLGPPRFSSYQPLYGLSFALKISQNGLVRAENHQFEVFVFPQDKNRRRG